MTTYDFSGNFITLDKTASGADIRFDMIEDEDGGVWWAYGHVDEDTLADEINRWFIHTGAVTDPDDMIQVGTPVRHLWARYADDDPYGERFELCERPRRSWRRLWRRDPNVFPVTRLWL